MILRRLSANLREQNWTAITIEFVLLVLGVYLGVIAANWNQAGVEQRETSRLLDQLEVELKKFVNGLNGPSRYYATTERYAHQANLGWQRDPSVSDRDFVIAAYQASQVTAVGNNAAVWAQIFGADQLRNIKDYEVRDGLGRVMTFDFTLVSLDAVSTPYRQEVRKVIPNEIQAAVRSRCGDRLVPDGSFELPQTCDIPIDPAEARAAAAALRARPALQEELRWHQAAVANQILNVRTLQQFTREVTELLERN